MEKKIKVREKEYIIKEIKYKDLTDLTDLSQGEAAKKLMMLSVGLTEEQYNELSMFEGLKIQEAVNDVNGFTKDFQKPLNK